MSFNIRERETSYGCQYLSVSAVENIAPKTVNDSHKSKDCYTLLMKNDMLHIIRVSSKHSLVLKW